MIMTTLEYTLSEERNVTLTCFLQKVSSEYVNVKNALLW